MISDQHGIKPRYQAPLVVPVQILEHGRGLALPAQQTRDAAGLDLRAAVLEPVVIGIGERAMIPTGIAVAIPPGYEGQVRPRSGLAAKYGVTVLNTPGTVDADYRGELQVILANLGQAPFAVERGDRIAQIIFAPVRGAVLGVVDALPESQRGERGFGSTGRG